ncbi:hypothetical protein SESBI_22671 [Sesbania bispinosa]|nr:hypothetical protein SESBI_22671 [Sesbania bispinosa]
MTSQNKDDESTSKNKENRRGRSILKDVAKARKENRKFEVGWNNRDQPIDSNKTKFSSYLGLVAKTMVGGGNNPNFTQSPLCVLCCIAAFEIDESRMKYVLGKVGELARILENSWGKLVHDEEGNINDQPPPKWVPMRLTFPATNCVMAARLHVTGDIMDENVNKFGMSVYQVSESVTQGEHLPPGPGHFTKGLEVCKNILDVLGLGVTPCDLYTNNPTYHLVGRGSVYNQLGDTLHNRPLPPEHVRGGVEIVLDGNAPLPVPNEDAGLLLLDDALGAHVAWPIGLIDLKIKVVVQSALGTKYVGSWSWLLSIPQLKLFITWIHWVSILDNVIQLRRMFDNAIKIYRANKGTKCLPRIMVQTVRLEKYSTELIDEVKQEWCRYVLETIITNK